MIHRISLNDCLEPYAPPAKVLNIGALDDTVFVTICEVGQDGSRKEIHTEIAEISVSLPSLLEAVAMLANDQEREHLRPPEASSSQGHKETRLAGARFAVAPVGPTAAVGALTTHLRYSAPQAASDQQHVPPVAEDRR